MKYSIALLFTPILFSCSRLDIQKDTPSCIKDGIRSFEQEACDEGGNVSEYEFQGKLVYVFDPGRCGADMQSYVYDEQCNHLGSLGGISGGTKINGEDFSSAVFKRNVWVKK